MISQAPQWILLPQLDEAVPIDAEQIPALSNVEVSDVSRTPYRCTATCSSERTSHRFTSPTEFYSVFSETSFTIADLEGTS